YGGRDALRRRLRLPGPATARVHEEILRGAVRGGADQGAGDEVLSDAAAGDPAGRPDRHRGEPQHARAARGKAAASRRAPDPRRLRRPDEPRGVAARRGGPGGAGAAPSQPGARPRAYRTGGAPRNALPARRLAEPPEHQLLEGRHDGALPAADET